MILQSIQPCVCFDFEHLRMLRLSVDFNFTHYTFKCDSGHTTLADFFLNLMVHVPAIYQGRYPSMPKKIDEFIWIHYSMLVWVHVNQSHLMGLINMKPRERVRAPVFKERDDLVPPLLLKIFDSSSSYLSWISSMDLPRNGCLSSMSCVLLPYLKKNSFFRVHSARILLPSSLSNA